MESDLKVRQNLEIELSMKQVSLNKHTKQFVLSCTSIDDKFYDDKYRVEWYMLPHEAKEHSICDYIVGEDCDLDEII